MKRIVTSFALVVLVLTAATVARAAEKYDVDTVHSHIGFTVKHMAVSSVRGDFKDYTAELRVDEDDVQNSSLVLRIDAASVDTDNQRRDDHLRSADFFEVETYPEIVFKSKSITRQGDGFEVTGDLTIKDVTREITFDLEINGPIKDPWGNHRVGAEGGLVIDRQDYGVKFSNIMDNGGLVVANDVKIAFALEASRKLGE
jgi:polyisoprenoid-binding protein YceI